MKVTFLFFLIKYHEEIYKSVKLIASVWKTARDVTREYIKRRVAQRLKRQIVVVTVEVGLFVGAFFLNFYHPSLLARLMASLVLWGVSLYNLSELCFYTIPELIKVHKVLKGKIGYALKYFLKISLVTELMEGNIIFLVICLSLALSSRTFLGTSFSFIDPWMELFSMIQ